MKKLVNLIAIASLLLCIGCSTVTSDGPYNGDSTLYRADFAITSAYSVLHTFVLWEYQNRPALTATPEITKAADYIRVNASRWITTAIALRDSYKRAPSDASKSALLLVLEELQTAMNQAIGYMSQGTSFTSVTATGAAVISGPTLKLEK